jgi:orotate phosphoribosyltransferase
MEEHLQIREMTATTPAVDMELLRSRLIDLLATRSARQGEFRLASGKMSTLYIDARMTTMSPEGLSVIGPLALDRIRNSGWNVASVGGLTLGADPISYAISYASAATASPLRAFTVRKELKQHGTGKLIEGPYEQGDRVAVIEDVITTGGSALRAIEALVNGGANIAGVLGLVDREEGGRAAIEGAGFQVIALATASEIVARMDRNRG